MAGAERLHRYDVQVEWTGADGAGTTGYVEYSRAHVITASGRPDLPGSADPAFRGDAARWNPEQLLLGALSACHQLWYLHLCAEAGVVVLAYRDEAEAVMQETADGGGRFASATLRPRVTIAADGDAMLAERLHDDAGAQCFIARSVNFAVHHAPCVTCAA